MISVIIPLYNKEETIRRALKSIQHQSLQPDELIVIDDGSTDRSITRVREMEDERTHLISQSNQGVSAARNRGIAEAKGDYIAFLDADDEWHQDFLSTMLHLLDKYPQCNIAASNYYKVNKRGDKTIAKLNHLHLPQGEGILYNYFEVSATSEPPINSSCVMLRTSAIKAIGGFPIGIGQGEDLLTWARLAVGNQIAYYNIPLSKFYTEQTGTMSAPKRIPSLNDVVGRELAILQQKHPDTPGLKDYVAHWHKMRASIYLRLKGYNKLCRQEIILARQWNPAAKHLNLYSLLLLLPYGTRMDFLHHYHA